MTEEEALFAAVLDNPAENTVRLVVADFLEETNRPAWASYIRTTIAGESYEKKYNTTMSAVCRDMGISDLFGRLIGTSFAMDRGFISTINVLALNFPLVAERVFPQHPVTYAVPSNIIPEPLPNWAAEDGKPGAPYHGIYGLPSDDVEAYGAPHTSRFFLPRYLFPFMSRDTKVNQVPEDGNAWWCYESAERCRQVINEACLAFGNTFRPPKVTNDQRPAT